MRRAALNIALALAAAAAALLLAEAAVRAFRPGLTAPPLYPENPFWRHDPELGWFHRPGQTGVFSAPEFSHRVTINSMGFRDRERDPSPPPEGTLRIAVLGDSFTWGHGVEDGEIFTRLMEELMPSTEVWNLGVSGYATDQELLLYRREADRLKAGLVMVMVCRNDFAANTTPLSGRYFKPWFRPEGGGFALDGEPVPRPGTLSRWAGALRRRSAFANGLWMLAVDAGLAPRGPRSWEVQAATMGFLLDSFRREAAGRGARFVPVIVPSVAHVYYEQVHAQEARNDALLRSWAEESGGTVLDLTPGFRRAFAETGRRLHYHRDKHWNAAGHRLAAELLAGMLADHAAPDHSM